MNILIATYEFPPFRGGIGTYCHEMALAACRLGHDVTVLAPDYGRDNRASDSTLPFRVIRFAGNRWAAWRMPGLMLALWRVGLSRFDVVHAADFPIIVAMATFNRWVRLPFLATVHGTEIHAFKRSRLTRWLGVTSPLQNAWRVTANSHYTASLAVANDPELEDADLVTTHLGVGAQWFAKAEPADVLLKQLGIPKRRKIILTVARLVERKGHRLLLKGLRELRPENKDELCYVAAGKADDRMFAEELQTLAGDTGVQVVFADDLTNKDIHCLYAVSWLYAMLAEHDPNKVEGFGLVYLEAAAQGLPALAAAVGGIPEVVVDGATGVVLRELTPSAVARQIEAWIDNPEALAKLGAEASHRAKAFTWDRCARQTYTVEL